MNNLTEDEEMLYYLDIGVSMLCENEDDIDGFEGCGAYADGYCTTKK